MNSSQHGYGLGIRWGDGRDGSSWLATMEFALEFALKFAPEFVLVFVLEFVLECVLEFALEFGLEFVLEFVPEAYWELPSSPIVESRQ